MTVIVTVNASIDEAEVNKLNERARREGRASRSAADIVEAAVADAVRHHWIVWSFVTTVRMHRLDE